MKNIMKSVVLLLFLVLLLLYPAPIIASTKTGLLTLETQKSSSRSLSILCAHSLDDLLSSASNDWKIIRTHFQIGS